MYLLHFLFLFFFLFPHRFDQLRTMAIRSIHLGGAVHCGRRQWRRRGHRILWRFIYSPYSQLWKTGSLLALPPDAGEIVLMASTKRLPRICAFFFIGGRSVFEKKKRNPSDNLSLQFHRSTFADNQVFFFDPTSPNFSCDFCPKWEMRNALILLEVEWTACPQNKTEKLSHV